MTNDIQFVPGLRRRVYEHITRYPESHDQKNWIDHCGTVCCIGGWAISLYFQTTSESTFMSSCPDNDVEGTAAKLLGLSFDEAASLFRMENDAALEMLKELVQLEEKGEEERCV